MTFLRIVLLAVLGWYLLRWLAGWLSGGSRTKRDAGRDKDPERYGDLTDQSIDDADYEDL